MATESDSLLATEPKTFGERLMTGVVAQGGPEKNQHRVAEWFAKKHKIQISGTMIWRYIKDDALPRMEQIREYAIALDLTVEWLITGRGPERPMDPLEPDERELIDLARELGQVRDLVGHLRHIRNQKADASPSGTHRAA